MEFAQNNGLIGIITARDCPSCGHHEIGITTSDGTFLTLKPGTWVKILNEAPSLKPLNSLKKSTDHDCQQSRPEMDSERIPWVPGPARKFRSLVLKYGVMIPAGLKSEGVDGDIFETAYLQKLRSLLEKQTEKPMAVIFDQFFTAPHLASGNPGEMASNMWNELEEIREPAERIRKWFTRSEGDGISILATNISKEAPIEFPMDDSQLSKELERLTLEEFLSLL
ncbi:hypothetical protein ACFL2O_01255 [Thermodesulfobacteriota bacterium]